MSHFNADQIQRLSAFAQAEALHDRMLDEYCALIAGTRRPRALERIALTQRLMSFLGGGFAACGGIEGIRMN